MRYRLAVTSTLDGNLEDHRTGQVLGQIVVLVESIPAAVRDKVKLPLRETQRRSNRNPDYNAFLKYFRGNVSAATSNVVNGDIGGIDVVLDFVSQRAVVQPCEPCNYTEHNAPEYKLAKSVIHLSSRSVTRQRRVRYTGDYRTLSYLH